MAVRESGADDGKEDDDDDEEESSSESSCLTKISLCEIHKTTKNAIISLDLSERKLCH